MTQKIEMPVLVVSNSGAIVPATELPASSNPGDQAAATNCPGMTATISPPIPLLTGNPTR